jgi:predicted HD phosphohydrolase
MTSVGITRMDQTTEADRAIIGPALARHRATMQAQLPLTVLQMLREQAGETLGYQIDRLQHSLQTATRAFREGRDEETVMLALLHDVGDGIGLFNHSEFAAAMLRPFVSDRNAWIARHHGLFQGYYYYGFIGKNPDERDKYRGHPHFDACLDFCDRWDQVSFDPGYDTMPLSAFEPMVHRLFAKTPWSFD